MGANKNRSVTVFGDSISKGVGYENGGFKFLNPTAVSIVEQNLGIKIRNFSSIGQTVKKTYERGVIERFLAERQPGTEAVAVFSLGGNDSCFDWSDVEKQPSSPHKEFNPLKDFCRQLDGMTKKLLKNGVKVVFTSLTPVDSVRYFNNFISKKVDGARVLEFLKGDVSNIYRHQERYNYAVLDCALKNRCRILDTRTDFLMDFNYLDCYCLDGIHPNENGQKRIAESILAQIS